LTAIIPYFAIEKTAPAHNPQNCWRAPAITMKHLYLYPHSNPRGDCRASSHPKFQCGYLAFFG